MRWLAAAACVGLVGCMGHAQTGVKTPLGKRSGHTGGVVEGHASYTNDSIVGFGLGVGAHGAPDNSGLSLAPTVTLMTKSTTRRPFAIGRFSLDLFHLESVDGEGSTSFGGPTLDAGIAIPYRSVDWSGCKSWGPSLGEQRFITIVAGVRYEPRDDVDGQAYGVVMVGIGMRSVPCKWQK